MDNQLPIQHFLEKHRGERHVIVLHNSPDPDAISSAYAHSLISQEFGIETEILYSGKASTRQNMALVRLLGIDLQKLGDHPNLSRYQGAVFVDTQGTTSDQIVSALEEAGVPVLMVIDHREPVGQLHPEFRDVRPTGATATIYAGYLEAGILDLNKTRREHVNAATALLFGIITDTVSFVTAQPEDYAAAAFLSRFRDAEFLEHIMSQARSKQVMDIIRRALGDRDIVENYSVAGIGYLRSEDQEAISKAAEFLLTEENVHTAIVYGIVRVGEAEETLVGAMRTSKITLDPEEFLREVFGSSLLEDQNNPDSLCSGTFAIPVGFLTGASGDGMQEMKWQVFDAQVKYRLLSRIGATPEQIEEISRIEVES